MNDGVSDTSHAELEKLRKRLVAAEKIGRVGHWEFDMASRTMHCSEQIHEIFGDAPGGPQATWRGMKSHVFPEDLSRLEAGIRQFLAGDSEFGIRFRIVSKSGKLRWMHGLAEKRLNAAGKLAALTGTLQDITKGVRSERLLISEARMLKALSSDLPLKAILEEVLRSVETVAPAAVTTIHLVGPEGSHLYPGAVSEHSAGFNEELGPIPIGPCSLCCGTAAFRREPVIVENIEVDSLWEGCRDIALKHGLRACWSVPVEDSTGKVLAAFAMYYREPCLPEPEDLALSHAIANVICIALERDRREAALKASQQRFHGTFLNAATGMAVTTLDGRFLEVNAAYCRMTGYSDSELYNMDIQSLARPDEVADLNTRLIELVQGEKEAQVYERLLLTKEGKLVWIRVSASTLRDRSGAPVAIIRIAEDIDQQKRAQDEILRLNASLEERVHQRTAELAAANKEMESFSYSVSHDLRAPLNTVNGFGQLLLRTNGKNLDEKGLHYLDRMRAGSEQMGELIERMLLLAKIARDPLQIESVDLADMAAKILAALQQTGAQRRAEFFIQTPLVTRGDPVMLSIVLQNLLSNAWKYSAKKALAKIEVGSQPGDDGGIIYFVRDNGAGFDMAYADKLFVAFQRLHSPTEFEGIGVGLANVKRAIGRHAGRVWAEGKPEAGATFYFTTSASASSMRRRRA
jgi:PAS domain S-box-containing protein